MLVAFLFVLINFVVDLIYVRGRSAHPHLRPERLRADAGRTRRASHLSPPRRASAGDAGARRSRLAAFLDSDLLHSFLRSKLVVVAALLTAGDRARGAAGAADRPARSLRPQVAEPARRQHAAGLGERRRRRLPARHRRPGPRHPLHHPLRHALLAADRHVLGAARQRTSGCRSGCGPAMSAAASTP